MPFFQTGSWDREDQNRAKELLREIEEEVEKKYSSQTKVKQKTYELLQLGLDAASRPSPEAKPDLNRAVLSQDGKKAARELLIVLEKMNADVEPSTELLRRFEVAVGTFRQQVICDSVAPKYEVEETPPLTFEEDDVREDFIQQEFEAKHHAMMESISEEHGCLDSPTPSELDQAERKSEDFEEDVAVDEAQVTKLMWEHQNSEPPVNWMTENP